MEKVVKKEEKKRRSKIQGKYRTMFQTRRFSVHALPRCARNFPGCRDAR